MSYYTVRLPSQFNAGTLYPLISGLLGPNLKPNHQQVYFDFSSLAFIECTGVTVFANMIDWLVRHGVKCGFINHDNGRDASRYLDDCGFFLAYLGQALSAQAVLRETTMPLMKVQHSDSYAWLERTFRPWLSNILGTNPASLYSLSASIKEIFNNIEDHSEQHTGCIHAQWYPKRKRISIGISDIGIGIPRSIGRKYPGYSDGEAILFATTEGVTTKSTLRNYGAGLCVLIDYVVKNNGGRIDIRSGFGWAQCYIDHGKVAKNFNPSGFYPGTIFNITLRTDRIESLIDERESLEW